MSNLAIRIEGLGKRYRIGTRQERYPTLREALSRLARAPVRQLLRNRHAPPAIRDAQADSIWALRDISLEVERGEVLGIIGRNGAGKSTLLKILSRITEPTEGFADLYGRVGSLLEVGTGFHPELTGRENIYLNGAILGMTKGEIERKFDEIVAFAEVERFIDTPVKRYSSGMYVRLAFAVAAHLEPEILVVDEVLAVGDAQFQQKCLGKMSDVAKGGRTVLFVSHNMAAVQRLCGRGVLLDQGRVATVGPVGEVVDHYLGNGAAGTPLHPFNDRSRSGTGWAHVTAIRLLDGAGRAVDAVPCDADLRFEVDLQLTDAHSSGASLRGLVLELVICSAHGQPLLSLMNVDDTGVELPANASGRVQVVLPGPTFIPGTYSITVFLGLPFLQHVDEIPDAIRFGILPPANPWRPYEFYESRGLVCRKATWRCVDGVDRGVGAHPAGS